MQRTQLKIHKTNNNTKKDTRKLQQKLNNTNRNKRITRYNKYKKLKYRNTTKIQIITKLQTNTNTTKSKIQKNNNTTKIQQKYK